MYLDWYFFVHGVQSELDQISLNILLFVPFGLLWPVIRKNRCSIRGIFVLGFIISLSVEVTQYFSMRGVFDIEDLITNVIGTVIGGVIIKVIFYMISKIKSIFI